jgi:hypothetical protein
MLCSHGCGYEEFCLLSPLVTRFMWVSSILKMEATRSSETSVDFNRLHGVKSQKIELFSLYISFTFRVCNDSDHCSVNTDFLLLIQFRQIQRSSAFVSLHITIIFIEKKNAATYVVEKTETGIICTTHFLSKSWRFRNNFNHSTSCTTIQYNLEYPEAFTKTKTEQHNSRAAGSFIPTTYTPEDGRLGQTCRVVLWWRHVNVNWSCTWAARSGTQSCMHTATGCCNVILIMSSWNGSRDSVIGTVTGYGLTERGLGVRVPVGSRILSPPCRPNRLWGPPILLSNGCRGLFSRG